MSHSYVSNIIHCTFGTKERFPFIDAKLESRLWPYLGGIAKENRMKPLAIGGTKPDISLLIPYNHPASQIGGDRLRQEH